MYRLHMARRRGFVPVAETRRRTAGICCSVCVFYVAFHKLQRKLLASARTSPLQILFFFNTHTKIMAYSKSYTPLFWRGEEDFRLERRARKTAGIRCFVVGRYLRPAQAMLACLPSNPLFSRQEIMQAAHKCVPPALWRGEEDLNLRRLLTSHDFQSCALNRSAISASLPGNLSAEPII